MLADFYGNFGRPDLFHEADSDRGVYSYKGGEEKNGKKKGGKGRKKEK